MSLDKLNEAFAKTDALEAKATKRVKEAKKVETLDEAEKRILAMKLTDVETAVVRKVFDLWRAGRLDRPDKRVSKKSVFESHQAWLQAERERKKAKVIASKRDNCWIVTDEETLQKLEDALENEPIVALDTETTGVDIFEDRMVGFSGYFTNADVLWYVPFGHTTGQTQLPKERVIPFWRKCVTGRKTIWHNAKFDLHMTMNDGITPDAPWWDTLVAMRILNNNEPSYRLKELHTKYCDSDEAILFEDLFDDFTIYDKDIVLAGIYAALDAKKTWDLYAFQKPYIDTRDRLRTVWYEIEQKLLDVDFKMERNGMSVDLEWLSNLREELVPRLEEAKKAVIEAFDLPDDFNFNSPQQMAHLVYDLAGADPTFPRRFRKNDRSTASEVLDALCEDVPALSPLLEYRMIEKLLTAFVDKIPLAIEPTDGKIHFSLDSTATETGRYACRGYGNKGKKKGVNIQQIPSRTKEGVKVRMAFIPQDGWLFVGADLSQIEPRIISHILYTEFGDGSMRQIYLDGVDLYTNMGMKTFGLPYENCVDKAYDPTGTFKPRALMKTGVLAFLYGQTPKAFARKMHVSDEIAEQFFAGMQNAFPGLKPFRESIMSHLLTEGNVAYAETLFGRKRRFPDYRKNVHELRQLESKRYWSLSESERNRLWELRRAVSSVQRQAVNTRVQGSAADTIKLIAIRLAEESAKRGWRFLLTIHDETKTEIPKKDVTPENIALVESIMTKTVELSVPLKTDLVIEPRWMAEYKADEWDFEACAPKRKNEEVA